MNCHGQKTRVVLTAMQSDGMSLRVAGTSKSGTCFVNDFLLRSRPQNRFPGPRVFPKAILIAGMSLCGVGTLSSGYWLW
jgi:hypothetical protein